MNLNITIALLVVLSVFITKYIVDMNTDAFSKVALCLITLSMSLIMSFFLFIRIKYKL